MERGWPVLGGEGRLGRGDVRAEDGEVTRCRSGRRKGGVSQGNHEGPEVGRCPACRRAAERMSLREGELAGGEGVGRAWCQWPVSA